MKKNLVAILLLAAGIGSAQADTYYIKLQGSSAWANKPAEQVVEIAADDFLARLANDERYSGGTLWVAAGTYQLKDIFVVKPNQQLIGGFAGTENSPADRAKGDLDGNGMIEPWEFTNATILEPAANMAERKTQRAIVQNPANGTNTIVDGLVFQNFHHTNDNSPVVFINNTTAEMRNCIVRDCSMELDGWVNGVLMLTAGKASNILMEFCHTKQLGADKNLAGVFHVNGNGKAYGCVVRGCSVTNGDGVALNRGWGGGFYLNSQAGGVATLVNCVAHNNYASGLGGGIVMYTASDQVINCTATRNVSGVNTGGGILMRVGGHLYNTVAWGNKGKDAPAQDIIFHEAGTGNSNVFNINNIAGKRATSNWQSSPANFPGFQYWFPVTQNDGVGEPSNTVDKLDADPPQYAPHFVSPTAFTGLSSASVDGTSSAEDRAAIRSANWSLAQNSQLVDKGNDLYLDVDMTIDLLGRERTYGMNPDLGAYEYNPTSGTRSNRAIAFNIAKDGSRIDVSGIEGNFTVEVFDIAGRHIVSKQATVTASIELRDNGIYLFKVTAKEGSKTVKITI